MGAPSTVTPLSKKTPNDRPDDRLDSWKEIAAYLNRDVTTVQRWEKRQGMPVHRHLHDRMRSVYASRAELDAWERKRNPPTTQENEDNTSADDWSPDSSHLTHHTPGPGDPLFVSDRSVKPEAQPIFTAPPGLHLLC